MRKHLRIPLFLIIAIMVLALCGCSRYEEPFDAAHVAVVTDTGDSYSYSLYPSQKQLIYDDITYSYSVSRSDDAITYTVYYPNGGSYYETRGGDAETSGWNNQYNIGTTYASGEELVSLLSSHYYISHSSPNFGHFLMLILCLGTGCFNLFLPEAAWHLAHIFRRWQYESVEPSDAGIIWTRIGGILCIIMGIILFFSKWS